MIGKRSHPGRYYDRLTGLFLALGSRGRAQSIHRAVWELPGMKLEDALNSSNARVLAELCKLSSDELRVADLGCGVGGSLFYLLQHGLNPSMAIGVTISAVQAGLAQLAVRQHGYEGRVHFVVGNFLELPLYPGFDFAWSIEASVHAHNPDGFFDQAAGLLRPGGRLVICDDFLRKESAALSRKEQRMVSLFQRGWQAPGLRTVEQVTQLAGIHGLGLIRCDDLTRFLRLRAIPDGPAQLLAQAEEQLRGEHLLLRNLLGSMALQQCLRQGITGYCFLVFEKQAGG